VIPAVETLKDFCAKELKNKSYFTLHLKSRRDLVENVIKDAIVNKTKPYLKKQTKCENGFLVDIVIEEKLEPSLNEITKQEGNLPLFFFLFGLFIITVL